MIGPRHYPNGFYYVSKDDPALDASREDFDLAKYLETGDRKHLPIKDGAVPTVFYLRRLTLSQYEAVAQASGPSQNRLAVAYGIERIENFLGPTGERVHVAHTGEGDQRRLDMDSLKAIFAPGLFAELAIAILYISGLDPLAERRSGSSPG